MIEVLNFIVGLVFTVFAFLFMVGTSVLVHEKKQRQKVPHGVYGQQNLKSAS